MTGHVQERLLELRLCQGRSRALFFLLDDQSGAQRGSAGGTGFNVRAVSGRGYRSCAEERFAVDVEPAATSRTVAGGRPRSVRCRV